MFSQIFGNLIGAFITQIFSSQVMFAMFAAFALSGFSLFLFLRKPEKVEEENTGSLLSSDNEEIKAKKSKETLDHSNDTDEVTGSDASEVVHQATLGSTFQLLTTSKMIRVCMMIIMGGIVLAFFSGLLSKLISNTVADKDERLSKALY